MVDKVEGGVKNLKKWVTSFMDGPLVGLPLHSEGYLQSEKIFGPKIQVFFLQFSRIMYVFDTLLFFMLHLLF